MRSARRRRPPSCARPTRASRPCASGSAKSSHAPSARRRASSSRSPRAPSPAARSPRLSPPGCEISPRARQTLRREAHEASSAVSQVEIELARLDAESTDARRRLGEAGEDAADGTREELEATARAARAPSGGARRRQPVREGGVRPREGAPLRAAHADGGPRAEPRRAGQAPPRADGDGRPPLRRDVRGGGVELRRGRFDALPRAAKGGSASPSRRATTRSRESRSSCARPASASAGCRSSPAARRRSARCRSSSRSSSRGRARSTCSTRSRRRSTTRTSAASSASCGSSPSGRSSSSSRTRSARWKRRTCCTA